MSKLSISEKILKGISGLFSIPLGFKICQPNTKILTVRFGKVDRIINSGIFWTPLGYSYHEIFCGKQTIHLKNMKLTDIDNIPIVTDVIISYTIDDIENSIIISLCYKDVIVSGIPT